MTVIAAMVSADRCNCSTAVPLFWPVLSKWNYRQLQKSYLTVSVVSLATFASSLNTMSDSFISEMRAKLLELREELEAIAATRDESSQVVQLDQARLGRLSRMDAMQAQAMSQASGRRREIMLRKISAALERIDNDNYGLCQTCEELIDRKRLEFDPTAVLCIECARKAEQQ